MEPFTVKPSQEMIVIGVDVGTTSVRLAIVSFEGENAQNSKVLSSHKQDISCRQDGIKFEQKSSEIWEAICKCSIHAIREANVDPDLIKGIAFSATCSLVVESNQKTNDEYDIIMWADHRAVEQALRITESKSEVLDQFGGICSPEFSLAKLIWLKENDKQRFDSSKAFFELPDWLVYRCISPNDEESNYREDMPRSLCSVVCKWGFDVGAYKHCDLITTLDSDIHRKIGQTVMEPGTIGGFMSLKSATELGLLLNNSDDKENLKSRNAPNVVVGTSLIDAHSGMLAMLSSIEGDCSSDFVDRQELESTVCSLSGTSTCIMSLSKKSHFTHGVWGPYKNVILNGYYLLEAGQSMTGRLIEICIENHEEGKEQLKYKSMYQIIGDMNSNILMSSKSPKVDGLHVLPTFHGNRSPFANPRLKGGIYGLSSENKQQGLLNHYIATIESLAYETKLITETLGTKISKLLLSGGMMKNEFFIQTLANVLQCPVVIMGLADVDFMVMGSSLVARHAVLVNLDQSNLSSGIKNAQKGLAKSSIEGIKFDQLKTRAFEPDIESFVYHAKKYACYREFVELSLRIDKIMHN